MAGQPPPPSLLVNVPRLVTAYYTERPDPSVRAQRVAFGTSGHRGSSLDVGFNEGHILAITQAICSYRRQEGIDGPLFLGWDTHALSEPARVTALEVLAANGVEVMLDAHDRFTPTPVVSQSIVTFNRGRVDGLADGVVITPSHNPPEYGGFKYDPLQAGRPTRRSPAGSRRGPMRCSRRACARWCGSRTSEPDGRPRSIPSTTWIRTSAPSGR